MLGGLFPVVTVALAYFILHERLRPMQRAGVLLALAGIPLISTRPQETHRLLEVAPQACGATVEP